MLAILFLLLLAVPLIELWVIVQVAREVGVVETFVLLILVSVAGAWLLRQQGMAAWVRLQQALARGEIPTKEVTDGALILLGGALLLTPGFVTDAVGPAAVVSADPRCLEGRGPAASRAPGASSSRDLLGARRASRKALRGS